ncbi:uncharacterized protein LOC135384843 [Ornithodoros turicata]|uniref:uncharacterized protein LOC135384843 n=1 Tax=Ornithodoros turicata TaxID=34597 RepID=UPI003139BA67
MGHIAVRLPPFWHRSPFIWFQQVEAQFLLAGITNQLTRYRHIVASLPPEVAMDISDVISGHTAPLHRTGSRLPFSSGPHYLIESGFNSSATEHRLSSPEPCRILTEQPLLMNELFFIVLRELFLQRLPATVQIVLSTAASLPLAILAKHADKVMEVALPGLSRPRYPAPTDRLAIRIPLCTTVTESHLHQMNSWQK